MTKQENIYIIKFLFSITFFLIYHLKNIFIFDFYLFFFSSEIRTNNETLVFITFPVSWMPTYIYYIHIELLLTNPYKCGLWLCMLHVFSIYTRSHLLKKKVENLEIVIIEFKIEKTKIQVLFINLCM